MKTPLPVLVLLTSSLLGLAQQLAAVPIIMDFDSLQETDLVGGGGSFAIDNNIRFQAVDSGVGFNHFDTALNFDADLTDTEALLHGVNNAEEARIDFRQSVASPFGAFFDLISLDIEVLTGTVGWLIVSPTGAALPLSAGTISFSGPDWQNIAFFTLRSTVVPNLDPLSQLVVDNIVIDDQPTVPTAVPEPASWLLFGAGVVCLGFMQRRRTCLLR